MRLVRGQRVKLTEAGVRYLQRTSTQRQSLINWKDRNGMLSTVSLDRANCNVLWDGNKSPSERMPIKFIMALD